MANDSLTSLYANAKDTAASAASARSASAASTAGNTGTSMAGIDNAKELSQRFLTLLVAQMKNQDPLNPTDNSQVTSQIAQINTVTGINNLNDTLSQITGQISTSQKLEASKLIGHQVLVPSDAVKVGDDGTATPFGVDLPADAAKLAITITDKAGNVVHKSEYTNQPAGVQSFKWDGHDASDAKADPGKYELHVKATDANGKDIAAKTLGTGYVDGVVSTQNGPKLDLGPGGLVSLDDIYQIL